MSTLVRRSLLAIPQISSRISLSKSSTVIRHGTCYIRKVSKPAFPKFLVRHLSAQAELQTPPTEEATGSRTFKNRRDNEITELMNELDAQAKIYGHVNKNMVIQALELVVESGNVNDFQAQMLLGCTGHALAAETQETRIEFTQNMWDRLLATGLEPKIVHYNALMKSHLENGFPFKPEEILAEMESKNLSPNKITLQRLISRYCETGDVKGASQVLESMKAAGQPVSDVIFNDFIKGHLKAGDVKSAKDMFEVMRSSGLNPNHLSHKVFLSGLAEKGDIDAILQFIDEQDSEQHMVSSNTLLPVATTLVKHGHAQLLDRLDFNRRKYSGYVNEVVQAMTEIAVMGHVEEAIWILKKARPSDKGSSSIGRFLISAMINSGKDVSLIMETGMQLVKEGYLEREINVIHASYQTCKPDVTLELIHEFGKMAYPIKLHYFLPCITQYRDQGNAEGIYKMLSIIDAVKVEDMSNENRRSVISDFLVPALTQLNVSPRDIATRIGASNIFHAAGITEVLVSLALIENNVQKAIEIVNDCDWLDLRKDMGRVPSFMYQAFMNNPSDWASSFELMECIRKKAAKSGGVRCNGVLLKKIVQNNRTGRDLEDIFKECKEKGMNISTFEGTVIAEILKRRNASEELLQLVDDLQIESETVIQTDKESYDSMEVQELEALVKSSGEKITYTMAKQLLIKYCTAGEVEKANALKADMELKNFTFGPDVLRALIGLSRRSDDLQGALHYLNKLQVDHPEYVFYSEVFLGVCLELVRAGRHEEASSKIQELSKSSPRAVKLIQTRDLSRDILRNMMNAYVTKTDFETSTQFMDDMYKCEAVPETSFYLPQEFIRTMLVENKEPQEILEAVKLVYNKWDLIVMPERVFKYFIMKEDAERLQEVVDITITKRGKYQTLLMLAEKFMDCDKKVQAKKVMETFQNTKFDFMRLIRIKINFWTNQQRIDAVENIVELGKEVINKNDKSYLLFLLMKAYCESGLMDKAQEVLLQYEELGLMPRPETLNYLAKYLRQNNMDVPFDVPQLKFRGQSKRQQTQEAQEISTISDGNTPNLNQ